MAAAEEEKNEPIENAENVQVSENEISEEVRDYAENEQEQVQEAERDFDEKFLLKERYEIDFSNPMPWLDNNSGKAYAAVDRIDATKKLFALVCSNLTSPRLSILSFLKSTSIPHLMKLVEYGVVDNPVEKSQCMALIYTVPLGGKVFVNGVSILGEISFETFKTTILGFLSLADTLKGHGITHRAIRCDNLYFKDSERTEIVLGDCAASFPAYHQPPAFETIENLYAAPEARGNGSEKDDFYAIGVTALSLISGKEPVTAASAAEVLYKKMKKSSFLALTEKQKISPAYVAVLKGLLSDSSDNRWGYSQVYNALEGKASSHPSLAAEEKPKRSLLIGGEKVYSPAEVVYALYSNIEEAYEIISGGKITEWVKNILDNDKLKTKVENILGQSAGAAPNKDLLVARTCVVICPSFPIRYKGMTFFPNGLPKAVFMAMKEQKNLSLFAEIFNTDLIKMWYQEQSNLRSPANASEFRSCINRRDIGYGLERVIYDFDDDLPCASPLLGKEFVDGPAPLLRAINNNYKDSDKDTMPYDRSIIAYLRSKIGKKVENIISDLNSSKEEIKASAILHLYSNIQNKHGPAILINLAKWTASISLPIVQIYHNRRYQKYLERELLKVYKKGRLFDIINLLENEDALYKDRTDYAAALSEANSLVLKKNKYLTEDEHLELSCRETAIKALSFISMFIMLASFAYNLTMWVLQ